MRLTGHEILLIAIVAGALLVGSLAKRYRNMHPTGNPVPDKLSEPQATGVGGYSRRLAR